MKRAAEKGIVLYGEDKKIRRAAEIHHEKELKEYPELGLEDDNLTSLCTQCHNKRHGRAIGRFVRRKKPVSEERW
ncbi:HNH endonuclease [[Clostridium] scindens]|uniref:HNH endonuclease n=1 Tax=Clostridium scindens (strain JCM 10418 / VPI 12708) TaxID=29347 RepID=UPI002E7701BA|nr:HNH endonuclease [[Clostridium] scindens]MEE0650148.1 HNH endonuclease [[Clostridium] scindens]